MLADLIVVFLRSHDIEFATSLDQVINEALPALQELKAAGKVRQSVPSILGGPVARTNGESVMAKTTGQ